MLYDGANHGGRQFGAGLKEMFAQRSGQATAEQEISELIAKQSTEKEFGFYDILPDIERVMPNDLPDAAALREPDNRDYFLQAASFRERADAEKLRARLTLKNFKAVTQARDVTGKGIYYRVRIGPYRDKRKAKTAKNKLQRLGVHPFIFSIEKN
jgi:cell division protein FtsN